MSRAIDNGVKELIKRGNHQDVFNTIAQLLSQRLPKLLEIELLSSESYPIIIDGDGTSNTTIFLQDDACIAVPKFRLLQTFVVARQILQRHLRAPPREGTDGSDVVMQAAAVMLLMDPEHLTAANSRKRLLLGLIQGGGGVNTTGSTTSNIHQSLQDEKYFIDSLLTSRLHRHNKSPTIWNHRQWLMERFLDHGLDLDVAGTMESVILVAAERHPRNYYAWSHARYLVDRMFVSKGRANVLYLYGVLQAAKKWTLSHHDDISGWAFLMFLLLSRCPEHAASVIAETLELALSFGWRNESVWYFLRNMVRQQTQEQLNSCEVAFKSTRLALLKGAGEEERRVLDRALNWIESEAME